MNETERLVEFGPVSMPWSLRPGDSKLVGGTIQPRSWMFRNGDVVPYEFGYNESVGPAVYADLPNKPEFFEQFGKVLEEEGLSDVLGLTLLGRRPANTIGMEKTFERANVMFNMSVEDFENEKKARGKEFIPAMWEVTSAKNDRPGSFVAGPQQ